jgi:hypothetical protein
MAHTTIGPTANLLYIAFPWRVYFTSCSKAFFKTCFLHPQVRTRALWATTGFAYVLNRRDRSSVARFYSTYRIERGKICAAQPQDIENKKEINVMKASCLRATACTRE